MTTPQTFAGLIASMGGVIAFAAKVGIGEHAAKKMRDRDSIAVEHWPAVIEAAAAEGIALTSDDFVDMRRRRFASERHGDAAA